MKRLKRMISLCLMGLLVTLTVYRMPTEAMEQELMAEEDTEESGDEGTTGTVGERLNGDYAYISEAGLVTDNSTVSGYSVRTGTAPFDENSTDPGNDSSELDNVVRSFDMVSYTTYFRSKVRTDAPCNSYRTGTLCFEFILPGEETQVQYETDSMGWLTAKKDATYSVKTGTYDGKDCQILRGSYLWEPSKENPSAIGESYQELNVVIRVLAMHNQEVICPKFTYWLEYNDCPDSGAVTGSEFVCSTHGEIEYKTITPPEITVTAASRYNVQLKECDNRAAYVESFDFSTGNSYAMNSDAGTVYGRAHVIGITIQLMGKTAEHGLRGCELPDGNNLTFTLELTDTYMGDNGEKHDTTKSYTPLVWSLEGNDKNDHTKQQYDERVLAGKYKLAAGGAPFNKLEGYSYSSCKDGGAWTGTQTGNRVTVTVSGYTIDLSQLPYGDANVNDSKYTYYDPTVIEEKYWNIQKACFSAGELWVVQPFFDQDGNYVVEQYGTGSFNLTVKDSDLTICTSSGQTSQVQMNTQDDQQVLAMALEQPGTIDQSVTYQKYDRVEYGVSLTDGCYEDGKDWIAAGGQLNIQEMLKHNTAEGMNTGTAYDDLVKFDDAFFVIEGIQPGSSAGLENMTSQFLYGAKPDKTGWDHKNLNPAEDGYDEEMRNATADDLIFFSSLEELQQKGYRCVAVLWEARGVASDQSTNCYFALRGHVADTAQANCVYMVTHCAQAWNKANVQELAAAYFHTEPAALTDEQYIEYMKEEFPSRTDEEEMSYADDYPTAFWVNNAQTKDGLTNYQKSSYDVNGYTGGSAGVSYGDSCLVVTYATQVTKKVVQTTSTGIEKSAYDMDANQRVADYAVNLSVVRTAGTSVTEGAEIITDLYIEDTLPKGLTYLTGSAFWGGTYQQSQEGTQGTISGGIPMEPEITSNTDGTTTLKWVLKDAVVATDPVTTFDPVYYSCEIGTPKNEDTDVKNNDQLKNSVIVWGEDEQKRDFNASDGNLAEMSIQVSKNNAISLSKTIENSYVEAGEPMKFTLNIGNNSANTMSMIAVDSLPYMGDEAGSYFNGDCLVTALQVQNPQLMQNITLYYTTEESERGKNSADYMEADFDENSKTWVSLAVDKTTGVVALPENFAPVAIAAVGTLEKHMTLKIDLNMVLSYGQPGDRVINRLSCGDLETGTTGEITGDPPDTGMDLPENGGMAAGILLLCLPLALNLLRFRRKSGRG
mgnify:CR=1 FL=1